MSINKSTDNRTINLMVFEHVFGNSILPPQDLARMVAARALHKKESTHRIWINVYDEVVRIPPTPQLPDVSGLDAVDRGFYWLGNEYYPGHEDNEVRSRFEGLVSEVRLDTPDFCADPSHAIGLWKHLSSFGSDVIVILGLDKDRNSVYTVLLEMVEDNGETVHISESAETLGRALGLVALKWKLGDDTNTWE